MNSDGIISSKLAAPVPSINQADPDHSEVAKLRSPQRSHARGTYHCDPLRHRPEDFLVPDGRAVFE